MVHHFQSVSLPTFHFPHQGPFGPLSPLCTIMCHNALLCYIFYPWCIMAHIGFSWCWGITIHKSQGLTLEKVVVELGDKDFSAGLSFVAISRVKTLKGLAFRTHFDHSRLKKPKETDSMLMLRRDTERRSQLGFQLNTYGMDLSEYVFAEDWSYSCYYYSQA